MNEKEMWSLFISERGITNNTYEAWCFGGDSKIANELAVLCLKGIKTTTASAHQLYGLENSPLPTAGDLNIILDADNNAVCIIETKKISICAFSEVSEEHALKEGEGDRSLAYWRKVHKDFFSKELKEYGLAFDDEMLIVCEEFEVVFK